MRTVFLDTVGILALFDVDDQWHVEARTAFESFSFHRRIAVTTEYVLSECGNAAARRPYRFDITELRQELLERSAVIDITANDLDLAWQAYYQRNAASAGIVDQLSFVVMRRLGLTDAFTNDRHFEAAGFKCLF